MNYKLKYIKYKLKYQNKKRQIIESTLNMNGGAAQVLLDDLTCPISQTIMIDPVIASDGHTYDRANIRRVIDGPNSVSPLTRENLNDVLLPNIPLRNIIENIIREGLINQEDIDEYRELVAEQNPDEDLAQIQDPEPMAEQNPEPMAEQNPDEDLAQVQDPEPMAEQNQANIIEDPNNQINIIDNNNNINQGNNNNFNHNNIMDYINFYNQMNNNIIDNNNNIIDNIIPLDNNNNPIPLDNNNNPIPLDNNNNPIPLDNNNNPIPLDNNNNPILMNN